MKQAPGKYERAGGGAEAPGRAFQSWNGWAQLRFAWAVASFFAVESAIFGVSVLPAAFFYQAHLAWHIGPPWLRIVVLGAAFLPTYLMFALMLMVCSAAAMRICGWRTPEDAELRIADLEWPLLDWGRYLISVHVVRVFAGTLLKNTPVWSAYLRMNGARLGRRVFVNSLAVNDHNLLEFGDGVVIGDAAHVSGHTVEQGMVKTGRVKLGPGVLVGVGAVLNIRIEAGAGCQIGALSVVPKGSTLDAQAVYVGIPVHKLGT